MGKGYTEYFIQLIDAVTKKSVDDSTGTYNVFEAPSTTNSLTIYANDNGVSASNPGTMKNGKMSFYTTSDKTSVNILIITSSGYTKLVNGITPSIHSIEMYLSPWNE